MAGGIIKCTEHERLLEWVAVWKSRLVAAEESGKLSPQRSSALRKQINASLPNRLKELDDLLDDYELEEYMRKAEKHLKFAEEELEPYLAKYLS